MFMLASCKRSSLSVHNQRTSVQSQITTHCRGEYKLDQKLEAIRNRVVPHGQLSFVQLEQLTQGKTDHKHKIKDAVQAVFDLSKKQWGSALDPTAVSYTHLTLPTNREV